jgi:hypothetical protein
VAPRGDETGISEVADVAAVAPEACQRMQQHPDAVVSDTRGSAVDIAVGCTDAKQAAPMGSTRENFQDGKCVEGGARMMTGTDERANLEAIRLQNEDFVQSLSTVQVWSCT